MNKTCIERNFNDSLDNIFQDLVTTRFALGNTYLGKDFLNRLYQTCLSWTLRTKCNFSIFFILERKAEKVLNIAAERGMASLTTSICKVMGMKCLHQNQLGNAMTWALRSQDSTFTTYLADKLLKLYCESGTFSSGDLLDHLGVSMVVSDRLTFLAKYREFHSLAGNGDYTIAAALLHSLLWSRLAPKYFWVTLLKDTLPFLAESVSECINDESGRKAFFSSEQTYELIHCLHELKEEIEELPTKQKNLLVEHEAELRRKLAINLSVALMQENDASAVKNLAKQSKSSIPAF